MELHSLKVKHLRQRARAFINIAHPEFRNDLMLEFEKRFSYEF